MNDHKNPGTVEHIEIDTLKFHKIYPGDILDLKVTSTVATNVEIFNQRFEKDPYMTGSPLITGYIVSPSGEVEVPLIGKVYLKDLTVEQAGDTIKKRLEEYIDFVTVRVKLVSYRITVLGEVRNPGTQIVQQPDINIFQAIGLAGDISDLGNRSKVYLIRKTDKGSDLISLNLNEKDFISSQYYYLLPNDVIYVEPFKLKSLRVNASTISITFSVASLIVIITRYFLL